MIPSGFIDTPLCLPLRLFASVDYYAAMAAHRHVIIDDNARYDKRQKSTHRMDIIDTHGIKTLTVPVSRPQNFHGQLRWSDIAISRHGLWWHVIDETLASAYGRTPFFEFYIDRLRQFFSASTPDTFPNVATLCREADKAIRKILSLNTSISYTSSTSGPSTPITATQQSNIIDPSTPVSATREATREATDSLNPASRDATALNPTAIEYYQVRRDKFGFVPHLSILDLIFNMGPESPLILHKMANTLPIPQ